MYMLDDNIFGPFLSQREREREREREITKPEMSFRLSFGSLPVCSYVKTDTVLYAAKKTTAN